MRKHQPALLGGLFIGVLTLLPIVNLGPCCCLWVLVGGVLVTYLLQQNKPEPIETGEAAIGGLMAGAVGGLIQCTVNAFFMRAMIPTILENMRSNPQVPAETMQMLERFVNGAGLTVALFFTVIPLFAVFGLLGSLLGLLFFRKKAVPQPPQPPPMSTTL